MLAQKTKEPGAKKVRNRRKLYLIGVIVLVVLLGVVYLGFGIYGATTFNSYSKRSGEFGDNTPAKYGLNFEEISFKTTYKDGITLRGWWVPNPAAKRALIMVHGQDADRTRMLPLAKPLWDKGYSLLFFDMRGMGKSDDTRYFYGSKERYDIVGAFDYVKSKGFDAAHIGIAAHSMGAASSLLAMGIDPDIKVVASYSAYADFNRVAQYRIEKDNHLPPFLLPGVYFVAGIWQGFDINQTSPEKVLPDLKEGKILLIHGDKDIQVPYNDHYPQLLKAGGKLISDTLVLQGADHADAIDLDNYRAIYLERVIAFFDKELAK